MVKLFEAKDKVGYVKGTAYGYNEAKRCPVWVEVIVGKTDEGKLKLSITGAILTPNGKSWIAGGQIDDTLREHIKLGEFTPNYKRNWSMEDVKKLLEIWEIWHLNDVKPIPEELKDEYLKFRREFYKEHGRYPDYEDYKAKFGKVYGAKWYSWELPKEVIDWIVDKFKGGAVYVNRL